MTPMLNVFINVNEMLGQVEFSLIISVVFCGCSCWGGVLGNELMSNIASDRICDKLCWLRTEVTKF